LQFQIEVLYFTRQYVEKEARGFQGHGRSNSKGKKFLIPDCATGSRKFCLLAHTQETKRTV
jgi:hypothetical protein